ncbi:TPA: hypothetical protein ACGVBC_001048 [Vibrio vulnificus]
MKSLKKFLMNTSIIPFICLTVMCTLLSFTVNAALTIQSSIKLWVSNGSNFSSLKTCPTQNELRNNQLTINAGASCSISDLATYILLKECVNPQNIVKVTIINGVGDKPNLSFDIEPATCEFLTNKLNNVQHEKRKATFMKAKKHYVIQFYAGNREPAPMLEKCADIPLYLHAENRMFYLISEVYEHYSEAKKIMSLINNKCKNIELWIRPVSIFQD